MKQSSSIICPYCNKEQAETIDDLAEVGDMDGSFEQFCDNEECDKTFSVEFEYRPYIRTFK